MNGAAKPLPAAFEQVAQRVAPGARLLAAEPLAGGNSAQVTVLDLQHPDGTRQKVIVRRHGLADRARNPRVAATEFRLLAWLSAAGLAVPQPYFVDLSGEVFVEPYVVLGFVDGATQLRPAPWQPLVGPLAEFLARLHALDGARAEAGLLPDYADGLARMLAEPPASLDEALQEGGIRAALTAAWPWPQRQPAVVLHGDYWPGNALWHAGQLAAVIDWEDAARGDPLADLGNARLELRWGFGREAMEAFTRRYCALTAIDLSTLPYWDLAAALRPAGKMGGWGLPEDEAALMRAEHGAFVAEALEGLVGKNWSTDCLHPAG